MTADLIETDPAQRLGEPATRRTRMTGADVQRKLPRAR
jgi:hypothetical protein